MIAVLTNVTSSNPIKNSSKWFRNGFDPFLKVFQVFFFLISCNAWIYNENNNGDLEVIGLYIGRRWNIWCETQSAQKLRLAYTLLFLAVCFNICEDPVSDSWSIYYQVQKSNVNNTDGESFLFLSWAGMLMECYHGGVSIWEFRENVLVTNL